jgi:hypothetical protein
MPDRPRFQAPERGASAPAWRGAAACLLVTVIAFVIALIATNAAGVPLRDPSNVTEGRLTKALLLVAVLIAVDCVLRGRERWPAARLAMTGGVVLAFYATYFAYRNLKSIVPLLRDELFDRRLGDIDRSVFGGSDPAEVLHDLLGTGISAEVLSVVYGFFFAFVPISIAFALVVPRDPRPGAVLRDRALAELGAGGRELLPAAVARPRVRPAGELRGSAVDRRQPPAERAAQPARRVPARPGRGRRGAEHRRVRLAALLDLLHGRDRDPPARRPAERARGGLGAAGTDRPGHPLLRLALRAR